MMAERKSRNCMEIDWKSRSGSIGVWNVEAKLSSWRIQRFRMDQQEEHSTRGGAIQYTVREIVPVVMQH